MALVLGGLTGGCTQAGDPVVTVTLKDDGSGGAAGQVVQMPVDAGSSPAPRCALPQLYTVFSGVIAHNCKVAANDPPLAASLERIMAFAQQNPPPMPGDTRAQLYCEANGTPWGIYPDPDGSGGSALCPALCDWVKEEVKSWTDQIQACEAGGPAPSQSPPGFQMP